MFERAFFDMNSDINVGIGEYYIVSDADNKVLKATGLGSCVGVFIYDKEKKIGGLAHILLPQSPNHKDKKSLKYADVALNKLINDLIGKGAKKDNFVAKIVGGAQLYVIENDTLKIGERNIESVEKILKEKQIPILGKDVGGNYGRTMEAYLSNGKVRVTSFKVKEKWI